MSKKTENINNQFNVIANALRTQFEMGCRLMDTTNSCEV